MRKLLILFLTISFIAACNNKKDDRRSTRDRDRESDDYRSRDEDKDRDSKDADYKDDRDKDRDRESDRDRDKEVSADGWPKASRDEFISSCVREAVNAGQTRSISERYCECMLEKMEGLYPDVNEVERLTEDDINRVVNRYKDKCLE